jgi:hypothetical protein
MAKHSGLGAESSEILVSPSDIARMAAVGTSTVSTWRKRYEEFPTPVSDSTPARPRFQLSEFVAWYEGQFPERDSLRAGDRVEQTVWSMVNSVRSADPVEEVVGAAAAALTWRRLDAEASERGSVRWSGEQIQDSDVPSFPDALDLDTRLSIRRLPSALESLLSDRVSDGTLKTVLQAAAVPSHDQVPAVALKLIKRMAAGARSGVGWTPQPLVKLMLGVVSGHPRIIWDPAAGTGNLLVQAGEVFSEAKLFGDEINVTAAALAQCRLYLTGRDGRVRARDSFEPQTSLDRFDAVIVDPPLGLRLSSRQVDALKARVPGLPLTSTSGDLAWVALAASAVKEGGTGVVITTQDALSRRGRDARLRDLLLERGCVEAVITLPRTSPRGPQLRSDTQVPLALWVVHAALAQNAEGMRPLLIDGDEVCRGISDTDDVVSHLETVFREARTDQRSLPRECVAPTTLQVRAKEANMLPRFWLVYAHTPELVESSERTMRRAAEAWNAQPTDDGPLPQPTVTEDVQTIVRVPLDTIARVLVARPAKQDRGPGDVLVPRVRIRDTRKSGVPNFDVGEPEPVDARDVTLEPDDIIVSDVLPHALQWEGPEPAVPAPGHRVLRVVDAGFIPAFVAMVLNSEAVQQAAGRGLAMRRLDLHAVTVPALTREDQARWISAYQQATDRLSALDASREALWEYRSAVQDLAGLGAH